jgi:large subunit ribosomal protein L4
MLVPVYNKENNKVSEFDLNDELTTYDPVNNHLIQETILSYLTNRRKGSASTLTRGMMSGSNRKPYKQKGTGLARMGTLKSPLLRGGGVIFGPHPREYNHKVQKKIKFKAMNLAIAQKFVSNSFFIVEDFNMDTPKTKEIVKFLNNFSIENNVILVTDQFDYNIFKSFANIPQVEAKVLREMNVYNIMKYKKVFITLSAIKRFQEERFV